MAENKTIYRFGNFTLIKEEHSLQSNQEEIHIRPKVFETLLYLVEHQGHLIKKESLLNEIWNNIIVTENTLNRCIKELREILNDDSHKPKYIQTVPRIGFRFIADVEKMPPDIFKRKGLVEESLHLRNSTNDQKENKKAIFNPPKRLRNVLVISSIIPFIILIILAGIQFLSNESKTYKSIAVLPFVNMSGDPDQEYFADGMTEALIAELAKIRLSRIISRTSVMNYKNVTKPLLQIANELNVDLIVEGSIQRTGQRVLVIVQLINPESDRHLWVGSYEKDVSDILILQQDLVQNIALQIKTELTQSQKNLVAVKVNPEAYELYLKGRYFWNKRTPEGFRKGINYFEQAVEIDSNYALAYVGLADCYNMLSNYDDIPPDEAYPEIKSSLEHAFGINNDLAEAFASFAFMKMFYEWDTDEAESALKKAIRLNPNYADAYHWYGLCLASQERFDEALSEMKKALSTDPLSIIINTNVGWIHYFAGRYEDAEKQIKQSLELDSTFVSAHVKLGWTYQQLGNLDGAVFEFQRGLNYLKNDPALLALLGHSYALANKKDEALKIIEKLKTISDKKYVTPYMIALIYTGLGDKEQALTWLYKAYREKDGWIAWIKVDPKLDPLRNEPAFKQLMAQVGL